MSYILDALRKSEQERQRGRVPDLYSHVDTQVPEPARRNIWPWVTAAVVVVNVGIIAILWSFFRAPVPSQQATVVPPSLATSPALETAPAVHPQPAASVPAPVTNVPTSAPRQEAVPTTVVVDQRPPVQSTPTVVAPHMAATPAMEEPVYRAPAPNVAYLPHLDELPASERANVPDMTFSSHMYSSVPRFRSVIINGKRLKEGEYFTETLQVREITDKGVIMSNGNVLFAVDVLGRWAQ